MRDGLDSLSVNKGILNYGLISLFDSKGKECLLWHPMLLKFFDSDVDLEISLEELRILHKGTTSLLFAIPILELQQVFAHLCSVNDSGFLVKIGYYNPDKNYCYYLNYNIFFECPIYRALKLVSSGQRAIVRKGDGEYHDERLFTRVGKDCFGKELILVESPGCNIYQAYTVDGAPVASIAKAWLSRNKTTH